MNLKKYAEECSRLQSYEKKSKKLGPNTPDSVMKSIISGMTNCKRKIEIMERTMAYEVNFKGKKL